MFYSAIVILALLLHFIINYDVLKESSKSSIIPAHKSYKIFLQGVLLYYITDLLWEPLYALKLKNLIFIETSIYFVFMAIAVVFWTQYVITYLNKKDIFAKILTYVGIFLLFMQIIVLIINCFRPIAFCFDEDVTYITGPARNLNIVLQIIMFLILSIHMFIYSSRTAGKLRRRHYTIGIFGIVMTVFLILQAQYPLLPFYSIGYMIGTSIHHTFVMEDEKDAYREKLERLVHVEKIQEAEITTTWHLAFTDSLTGIKNKLAYQEDTESINLRIKDGLLKDFGVAVFDVNNLKVVNDTKGHE